jgi:sirohydrochlorin ferrochelatase
MQIIFGFIICLLSFVFTASHAVAEGGAQVKTGFLLVAPDRGFLGNQEIRSLYEAFQRDHLVSLAWVGREYNGVGGEYSAYLARAADELRRSGATEIVAIPLFLSEADPVLKKVRPYLPAYAASGTLRWAAPMGESPLIAQILLDRVDALSREVEQERLIVVGIGAVDEESEKRLRADLERLVGYVGRYRSFKEATVAIYYDRETEAGLREKKNKAADDLIIRTAAKKGGTLLVPFFIGPKFDSHMSLTRWLSDKVKDLDVVYDGQEILPHPNLLLWLKKTANAFLPASRNETGVVVMPHGATQPWNDVVEEAIAPLASRYQIEMAYGMSDPVTLQRAISRLEEKGVRRIVFIRLYALSDQMKEATDYILGLSDTPPPHHHGAAPSPQVRSSALFSTFGGYEEDPALAQILHDRIVEVSRRPSEETFILVAHGAGEDEADARWLSIMRRQIERLRKDPHCAKLKAILPATVREDWPEKRATAVAKLKEMIEEGKRHGRVVLISHRLRGAGPYKQLLEEVGMKQGEDYEMNGKGFTPHPVLTRWLEAGIEREIVGMGGTRPADLKTAVSK